MEYLMGLFGGGGGGSSYGVMAGDAGFDWGTFAGQGGGSAPYGVMANNATPSLQSMAGGGSAMWGGGGINWDTVGKAGRALSDMGADDGDGFMGTPGITSQRGRGRQGALGDISAGFKAYRPWYMQPNDGLDPVIARLLGAR